MYPSATYQQCKERRLRRIRRAVPELVVAYEHGTLSLRQFHQFSRFGVREQKSALERRQQQLAPALVAAKTIEAILDPGTEVRLTDIVVAIRQAVTHSHGKACPPP